MIDILQKYVDLFLDKGIRLAVVTEVLVLSLGHIFALTVPMAILVGVLMAVGHLAADQEITALKATGVSLYRIAAPLIAVGLLFGIGMVAYNHYVLPRTNHRLTGLLIDIHQMRPTFTIRENAFVEIDDRHTIFVRHKNDRTGELREVILIQREGRGDTHPDVVVAQRGRLRTQSLGLIQLDLYNGEYHSLPDRSNPDVYHRTAFTRQTFTIDLGDDGALGGEHSRKNERSMDLHELDAARAEQMELHDRAIVEAREIVDDALAPLVVSLRTGRIDTEGSTGDPVTERSRLSGELDRKSRAMAVKAQVARSHWIRASRFAVEYHKKFSIPGACLIFVLVGVPLAVTTSRGGRGVSVGMSLAAFVVYYLFLSGGEKLADRGFAPPWLSMWAPNLILGPLGILLLYHSVQETRVIQIRAPRWLRRMRERTA
jgi:lipopolysaccharide export system permease protein